MGKASSHTPRDNKRGPGNFRKDSGQPRKQAGSFRKDDDRGSRPARAEGSDAKPFRGKSDRPFGKSENGDRKTRPYSPRTENRNTPSERPAGSRPYDRPGKTERSSGKFGDDKRGSRPPAEGRSFRDRPATNKWKSERPEGGAEGKPERSNRKFSDDSRGSRPPAEGRSFRDRPKSATNKWKSERPGGESAGKPERSDRKFGDDRKGSRPPADSRPFRDRPKPAHNKWRSERPEGEPADKQERGDRKFDGDRKGSRPPADSRPFRDRPKPLAKKWKAEGADGEPAGKTGRDRKPGDDNRSGKSQADSRPFRDRPKPATDKRKPAKPVKEPAVPETDEPRFADVVKQAFNGSDEGPKKMDHATREQFEDKVYGELGEVTSTVKKPYELKGKKKAAPDADAPAGKKSTKKKKYREEDEEEETKEGNDEMTLNKFIAHSGECSRREAAELVKQGKVKVNGELVTEPGYRVKQGDSVTMSGKKLTPQRELVYLLLNKPKGYITTNDDPQGRRTVMDLVSEPGVDRIFPVGRLDKDTTGLLLLTNDGDLTQKLSHPSYNIKKVYHVTLDKPLTKADFEKIVQGVELEDGKAIVDEMAYLEAKNELGVEIHSGKNRIVRRIFESQGYVVDKLDRMMYAGLTKKNLPRGKWRKLTDREVVLLKHFKS